MHSHPFSPQPPIHATSFEPTQLQMAAAYRQRVIRDRLRQLSSQHQAILEATYEPQPVSRQLEHEYGIASGAVAHVLSYARDARLPAARIEELVCRAIALVTEAHGAYVPWHPRSSRAVSATYHASSGGSAWMAGYASVGAAAQAVFAPAGAAGAFGPL